MRAVSLLYHDVTDKGELDSSGFPGAGANTYKLTKEIFREHLAGIHEAIETPPATLSGVRGGMKVSCPLFLTFDDGGVSAYLPIADMLESYGWYGHFFVTASYIGSPSFLNVRQIQELRRRGHEIGSHSYSHPSRMAHCTWEEMVDEWTTSRKMLSDILGEEVGMGSVPGGYYSRNVAEAAFSSGIRVLFTSEPVTKCQRVRETLVLGRYTMWRTTRPKTAAAIASGQIGPRQRQWLWWNTKKVAKAIGGDYYLRIRRLFLR